MGLELCRSHAESEAEVIKFHVVITFGRGGSTLEFERIGRNAVDIAADLGEEYPGARIVVKPL